eukprot:scaffold6323_cov121-Isochrysis_galbana.AAC.9
MDCVHYLSLFNRVDGKGRVNPYDCVVLSCAHAHALASSYECHWRTLVVLGCWRKIINASKHVWWAGADCGLHLRGRGARKGCESFALPFVRLAGKRPCRLRRGAPPSMKCVGVGVRAGWSLSVESAVGSRQQQQRHRQRHFPVFSARVW